jgi:hypothetical protein
MKGVTSIILMASITVAIAGVLWITTQREQSPQKLYEFDYSPAPINTSMVNEFNNLSKICDSLSLNTTATINLIEMSFSNQNTSSIPWLLEYGHNNTASLSYHARRYEYLYINVKNGPLTWSDVMKYTTKADSDLKTLSVYKRQYEILNDVVRT